MSACVCYVVLDYPVRSQTFVTDEIRELRRRGLRVFVVALEGGDRDLDVGEADVRVTDRRARSAGVARAALAMLLRRRSARSILRRGPLTLGMRWKLLSVAADAERAGVVAVHAHFAYRSADAAEVIGAALGVGHTLTAHARDLFVPEGDVDRRLDAARTVVTVCDYNLRWIATHHPAAASRTVVIPASTDVIRLVPRRAHTATPRIVSIGRLIDKKGFETVIDACAALHHPWRLQIIGEGPLDAALRARAARLGVEDRVDFAGALDHAETLDALAAADIYCGAFRVDDDGDRDSMPVVVKEAMAAGLPVVATDEVGVPEMVDHGRTGLLVPPDDAGALAVALDRLLADPAQRLQFGCRGRARAEECFDIRRQGERLIAEVLQC